MVRCRMDVVASRRAIWTLVAARLCLLSRWLTPRLHRCLYLSPQWGAGGSKSRASRAESTSTPRWCAGLATTWCGGRASRSACLLGPGWLCLGRHIRRAEIRYNTESEYLFHYSGFKHMVTPIPWLFLFFPFSWVNILIMYLAAPILGPQNYCALG